MPTYGTLTTQPQKTHPFIEQLLRTINPTNFEYQGSDECCQLLCFTLLCCTPICYMAYKNPSEDERRLLNGVRSELRIIGKDSEKELQHQDYQKLYSLFSGALRNVAVNKYRSALQTCETRVTAKDPNLLQN